MSDIDLDELRAELNDFAEPAIQGARSTRDERIVAGFQEIQRFVEDNGRTPQHGEAHDIFERFYAVRLDRLRALEECRSLLAPLDYQGLLVSLGLTPEESMGDDELVAELKRAPGSVDITELRHVRTGAEKRAAEEIAIRTGCEDFDTFKPAFDKVREELKAGVRHTGSFQTRSLDEIQEGAFFIVGGQIAYIADVGDEFTTDYERRDCRLRVVYDNATESNVLRRSLQRALHRDSAARFITDPDAGPLFSERPDDGDLVSGTIYVLRSKSDNPVVAAHRDVLHKIGVTGSDIETRIANARLDPTFLMADVDVVATYELYNINRMKLENIVHRVFGPARLDIEVRDRFGTPVVPREWFLVPVFVVDEVVKRIKDGTITQYVYDPKSAKLVKAGES